MDKQEAERLVRAIERTHVNWFRVEGVETKGQGYVLRCVYKEAIQGRFSRKETWVSRWINSPREWIDLLTRHHDDNREPL